MGRILVVGGGGREHALVRALRRSEWSPEVVCAPGNAGIAADGVRCVDVGVDDVEGLVVAAREEACDLVVVGPEAPLVGGLVDQLADGGVRAFGPTAAAARIEGSKAYAKEVMEAAGVPTAGHVVLRDLETALVELVDATYPLVLKADVLAAGKGVVICENEDEARVALEGFFLERRFGETAVVLEQFLEGEELSLLALCDGARAVAMAPARDFKRIGDGDSGPNTGGMGSYSPVADVGAEWAQELVELIHQPVVDELRRRGTPYHGVLYAGLMLTDAGPITLEFNARFGDPETQCVLPRLGSDLLDLLERAVRPGGLEGVELEWSPEPAVTLVLASGTYPASASLGDRISGLEEAASEPGVEILHAGTATDGRGGFVTAGGRVLNVTATGATLAEAREHAYAAAERIDFDGRQLRGDIAAEAAERVGA
ncbi:phosphoribosylamine--glycine ligase [uncultured Nocardioides sp.]|uniref:phosphoribosylamine--glycine ligase n=1 Tax=uncultured Nocardioides sp. TaxID=198441 RepID=UPI0025CC8BA9|nr:phosphoribosylamine--glycine ligase [uncultured Nocardioides sp.]